MAEENCRPDNKGDTLSFEWLIPHMTKETFKKGEYLFKKGDNAEKMFYIQKGTIKLLEINIIVGKGSVIGEMGIFSPYKERTASAVCEEDLEAYTMPMNKEGIIQLFFNDPPLVIELIQLSIKRFIENLTTTIAAKQKIESDLKIAHKIQADMLPTVFPKRKEFDIYATMEPAKEIGGDFYDFFFINEDELCFIIGDVSGKGVPAALFMAITKTLLKTEALRELSAGEILYNANNRIVPENDECMFATVLVAILNIKTGNLKFASAGHNPPLLCTKDKGFEYLDLKKSFVLGGMANMKFVSCELTMKPNDIIFLYTDGVNEAMNIDDKQFTEPKLKKDINELQDKSVVEIIQGIRKKVKEFVKEAPQSDDITMLTVKFYGE